MVTRKTIGEQQHSGNIPSKATPNIASVSLPGVICSKGEQRLFNAVLEMMELLQQARRCTRQGTRH